MPDRWTDTQSSRGPYTLNNVSKHVIEHHLLSLVLLNKRVKVGEEIFPEVIIEVIDHAVLQELAWRLLQPLLRRVAYKRILSLLLLGLAELHQILYITRIQQKDQSSKVTALVPQRSSAVNGHKLPKVLLMSD